MGKLLTVILITVSVLLSGCVPISQPPEVNGDNFLTFGDVTVCKVDSEIRFSATVHRTSGWVQHLLYLHGYHWLKEQSAIVSDARLSQLQHALGVLNPQLWDQLWHGVQNDATLDVKVYIEYQGSRVPANTLIASDDEVQVVDMVFLGCPYFDAVALRSLSVADCRVCPVFPLEQKALQERFIRGNGESGYEIETSLMFAEGTEVEVIIVVPKSNESGG